MTDSEIISQASKKQLNVACDATDATKFVLDDASVIKALECCSKDNVKDCDICPYNEKETNTYCANDLIKDTLALINRLKAQNKEFDEKIVMQMGLIEHQRDEIVALTGIIEKGDFTSYSACRAIEDRKRKNAEYINELKAEIERYKGVIKLLEKDVLTAKTEAIKEFAERLKCRASILCDKVTGLPISYTISNYNFYNLVKEMTEGSVQE